MHHEMMHVKCNQGGSRRCAGGAALITQGSPYWLHRPGTRYTQKNLPHAASAVHFTFNFSSRGLCGLVWVQCLQPSQVRSVCFLDSCIYSTVHDMWKNEDAVKGLCPVQSTTYLASLFELNSQDAPSQKQHLEPLSSVKNPAAEI